MYILIGNRVPVKSSGLAQGLTNAWLRAAQNLQMLLPGSPGLTMRANAPQ